MRSYWTARRSGETVDTHTFKVSQLCVCDSSQTSCVQIRLIQVVSDRHTLIPNCRWLIQLSFSNRIHLHSVQVMTRSSLWLCPQSQWLPTVDEIDITLFWRPWVVHSNKYWQHTHTISPLQKPHHAYCSSSSDLPSSVYKMFWSIVAVEIEKSTKKQVWIVWGKLWKGDAIWLGNSFPGHRLIDWFAKLVDESR